MNGSTITATLVLRTPLHVGSGVSTEAVDDLVYRNAQGTVLIPGTSLAGALRAIATRLAPHLDQGEVCIALQKNPKWDQPCECLTCQLFGTLNPQEDAKDGNATRLWIYDAKLRQSFPLQIRDGVGIDRVTGAAARAERLKFDLEIVPAGAEFLLRMEVSPRLFDAKHADQMLQLLAATLAEWQAGRGIVGGRAGRGMGAFDLKEIRYNKLTLSNAQALFEYLRQETDWSGKQGDATWLDKTVAIARAQVKSRPITNQEFLANSAVAQSLVQVDFTLAIEGPFLVNDLVMATRSGFDHAPLLNGSDKSKFAVLPGSSLRGVLRSQAERIARTLATLNVWGDNVIMDKLAGNKFKEICPACNPLVTKTDQPVASCNSFIKTLSLEERKQLEKSGAETDLCLACRLFGSTWNGSRLRIEDATMVRAALVDPKVLDFLAIDRFTGGGRDTAKFDAAVFWNPTFRVRLFLENPALWELGWLVLTLRDLHDGLATVGFGRSKGFGRGRITDLTLQLGMIQPNHPDFPQLSNTTKESGLYRIQTFEATFPAQADAPNASSIIDSTWVNEVNRWVQAFHTEIRNHPRSQRSEFEIKQDSYFDTDQNLTELYPARIYPAKVTVA